MLDLRKPTLRGMTELGTALREASLAAESMESVAGRVVRYLYDQLVDLRSGVRSCALVRLFKSHPFEELDDSLQAMAREVLGREPATPAMKVLVLLATAGDRPEWNSTDLSARHRAIPLPSPRLVEAYPMISNLIRQFGLDVAQVVEPHPDILVELEQRTYNVFYVPHALGSPSVYAQEDFVKPFGIRSVLGFGAMLPSGNLFTVILFSKVTISAETADLFRPIALSLKLALLPFDGRPISTPSARGGR